MPWNEPGSNNKGGSDNWSNNGSNNSGGNDSNNGSNNSGGNGGGNRGGNQPPDLDEVIKNITDKINGMFGAKKGGSNNGGNNNGDNGSNSPQDGGLGLGSIGIIALVAVAIWAVSGFYTVKEGRNAVVLRFGEYHATKQAGLNWRPKLIDTVQQVDIQTYNSVEVGYRTGGGSTKAKEDRESLMLTEDENIIDIELAVQYNINDATKFLFNVVTGEEDDVVRQSTESAVREIIGRNVMDFALTDGRGPIASETKSLLQKILDRYETGINVLAVELQNAQPPAQVKSAFDDAVKAREDREKFKNQAEAYANGVIPRARGEAAKQIEIAEGYKQSVIARAEGDANRFTSILAEYAKAPEITRDRLYIEAMESVLSNSSKLYMGNNDGEGGSGGNVFYLPLDKLIESGQKSTQSNSAGNGSNSGANSRTSSPPLGSTNNSSSSLPTGSSDTNAALRGNTNRQARSFQ